MSNDVQTNDYVSNYDVPVAATNFDLSNLQTKSAQIRYLFSQGLTRSQIASKLNIRYQHVRNVLITPVKKNG